MTRLALLLAVLAGPALALDPSRCEWERVGYSEYERAFPVQDLGGGLVAQAILHDDAHAARDGAPTNTRTFVEFCATGRTIQVDGFHATDADEPTPVVALVLEAAASPEPVTLEALRDRIRAAGTGAWILDASPQESCGCGLFYPDLR